MVRLAILCLPAMGSSCGADDCPSISVATDENDVAIHLRVETQAGVEVTTQQLEVAAGDLPICYQLPEVPPNEDGYLLWVTASILADTVSETQMVCPRTCPSMFCGASCDHFADLPAEDVPSLSFDLYP